jgi:hypothetical protein
MKIDFNNWILYIYLLSLGIGVGVVLSLGLFVAPLVFGINNTLGFDAISQLQSGIVMSSIFLKSSYYINYLAIIVLAYEAYKYINLYRDTYIQIVAFVVVFSAYMFTQFYIPSIIEYQLQGNSILENSAFKGLYKGSELDFAILSISLIALFLLRVNKLIQKPEKPTQNSGSCQANLS